MEQRAGLSKNDIGYIKHLAKTFAEKWTLEIIVAIANGKDAMGFNELMKSLDGISAAVLSNRLKNLQNDGYVKREVQAGPPARTFYGLTERGRNVVKVAYYVVQRKGKPAAGLDTYYMQNLKDITL